MNLKKTSVENRNVHVSKIETEYLQKEKWRANIKDFWHTTHSYLQKEKNLHRIVISRENPKNP